VRIGAQMSTAGGLNRVWERGDAQGCEALQIFTRSSRIWAAAPLDRGEVREFVTEARRRRLPLLAHDSYLINLASGDGALAARSRAAFAAELERCEALGVGFLVFHPGAHGGDGAEVGLRRVADALRHAVADSRGYRVRLLVELTAGQGTSLGHTFAQLRWLLDAVGAPRRVGVCFDTCHAFAAGHDLRQGYDAVWREFDAVVGLGRLHAFHLNDSRRELGSRVDRHAAIGAGQLGARFFQRLVRDPRFAGLPGVMELPPAEVARGMALLRRWRGRAHAGSVPLPAVRS
jgi:deoxyribonuclease-4